MQNKERKGIFISAEGPDGVGKSTQIQVIANSFQELGYQVITTREPGGSLVGEKIRQILLSDHMDPFTEALLFAAQRQEHIAEVIAPSLEKNMVVITDRYFDSTFAYQYYARGIAQAAELEEMVVRRQGMVPDYTFFFKAPFDVLTARMTGRAVATSTELDRFEKEQIDFRKKVYEGYMLRLGAEETRLPNRMIVINANQPVDGVSRDLKSYIQKQFKPRT